MSFVCLHICVPMHMYVHACEGQRLASRTFLGCSSPYFFEAGSLAQPKTTDSMRLACQLVPGILLSPPPQYGGTCSWTSLSPEC